MHCLKSLAPRLFAALLAAALALPVAAQNAAKDKEYTPSVGQEG